MARPLNWPALIMGGLTAGYGVLEIVRPQMLADQTRMTGSHPEVARKLRTASIGLGVRDVVSGLALALARTPTQRTVASAVRVVFDLADGAVLTRALPAGAPKGKILAVTTGWAALSAAAGVLARRGTG